MAATTAIGGEAELGEKTLCPLSLYLLRQIDGATHADAIEMWVAEIAAVPIRHAVDLDRAE